MALGISSGAVQIKRVVAADVVEQVGEVHNPFLGKRGGESDKLTVLDDAGGYLDEVFPLAGQEARGGHGPSRHRVDALEVTDADRGKGVEDAGREGTAQATTFEKQGVVV